MLPRVNYDLRRCTIREIKNLCALHHGYGDAGKSATYAFGVYEDGRIVAAYAWQPPAPGSSEAVCPTCPEGVLSLSRMVAVPRKERALNHVSRPLKRQMKHLIDRTRWPVLVTYSDEGEGHTGHVYKCSGWHHSGSREVAFYVDAQGVRRSSYNNGGTNTTGLTYGGTTTIHRWEHWICDDPSSWMKEHGWRRVPVPGKVWRSGNQAYQYVRTDTTQVDLFAGV